MIEDTIYELKSLYRDNMRIHCRKFGSGEKSAVIAGGVRGNEIQQMFSCAMLVKRLSELEKQGKITEGKSIAVVPVINPYSMNIEKRFWPTDNTDINRMFPGYNLGETTQRVAAGMFEKVTGYKYGIHFASNYIRENSYPIYVLWTRVGTTQRTQRLSVCRILSRENPIPTTPRP